MARTAGASISSDPLATTAGATAATAALGGTGGAASRHAPTTSSSEMPMATLQLAVSELPARNPTECTAAKTTSTPIAALRSCSSTGGHRVPANSTAVTAAYEIVAAQANQSTQPTTKPARSPKARRTYTRKPPASGYMAASSDKDTAPMSVYRPPTHQQIRMSVGVPAAAATRPGRRRMPTPIMLPKPKHRLKPRPSTRCSCWVAVT